MVLFDTLRLQATARRVANAQGLAGGKDAAADLMGRSLQQNMGDDDMGIWMINSGWWVGCHFVFSH